MKKSITLLLFFVMLLNLIPISATGEPQIVSCGFLSANGNEINYLQGDTHIRGYADIVNPSYINSSNVGELTVECYINGTLNSTEKITLSIEQNTRHKRMVTNTIEVPEGDSVVFKIYTVDSLGNKSSVIEINNSLTVPGAENDEVIYKKAIDISKAIGILSGYEDGTFKGSMSITRSEFAAVLVRLLNKQAQADLQKGQTLFTDVGETHWASGYINYITKLGYMSGLQNGTFGPEKRLTMQDAAEGLFNILGYTPVLSPLGYVDSAMEYGIMDGVELMPGSLVSRGALAKLIYNSIDIPLMEQVGFGSYLEYEIQDGSGDTYRKTLMSEKLGIVKLKAFAEKSYELDSASKANIVAVYVVNSYGCKYDDGDYNGGNTFAGYTWDINAGYTTLKSMVGYNTELYISYNENSNEAPVALYTERLPSTDEIEIKSENIDNISNDSFTIYIDYYENETSTRTKTLTIRNDAKVYINGFLNTSRNVADALYNFYGTATFSLQDNRTAEDFDTIHINDYKNVVVDYVDINMGKVIAKEGFSIIFKETNLDYSSTLIDAEGKKLDWSVLKENDILSVQRVVGNSRTISVCKLTRESVTGIISEIGYDRNNAEFRISDKSYRVDGQIIYPEDLALEDKGTFYLDTMGRIAYVQLERLSKYAYVLALGESGSINSTLQMKLLTYSGEIFTLDTTSAVKVTYNKNGYYVTESLNYKNILNLVKINDIIIYDTYNGRINKIILEDNTMKGQLDTKTFTKYTYADRAYYSKSNSAFTISGKKVYAKDNTVIMIAPTISNYYDEKDYAVIPLSALPDGIELDYVSAYDVNEYYEAGCILIQSHIDLTSPSEGLAVLKEITESEDDNGNIIRSYTVLQNGKEITLNANEDFDWDGSIADAFIPVKNIHGYIDGAKVIATADNAEDSVMLNNYGDVYNTYTSGVVTDININSVTINNNEMFIIPSTANVYLYDERFGEVSISNINCFDISLDPVSGQYIYSSYGEGDLSSVSILIREYDDLVKDVVLYFFGDKQNLTNTEISMCVTPEAAVSSVVYKNETNADNTPSLVLARYRAGKLIALTKSSISVLKSESAIFKCTMTGQFDNGDTFKSILVKDFNTMEPIRNVVSDTVSGSVDKNSENTVTVLFSDIESISNETVNYYDSGKYTKSLVISNTAEIYFNGALGITLDELSKFYGEITFSNKSSDNSYKTVSITDFTNTVVDYVNTTTGRVIAKQGLYIPYGNMNLNSFAVLYDKNGNKLEWSSLKENDIISTKITNKGTFTIYQSTLINDIVEGKITETSGSYFDAEYTISGNTYKADYQNLNKLRLEDEGTFYLDIMGRIAYFDTITKPVKYAYILDANYSGSIDETLLIKMFTSEGEIVTLDAASKVKVSYYNEGVYETKSIHSSELLERSEPYCIKSNDLIAYSINSNRCISSIIFPDPLQEGKAGTANLSRYVYSDWASFNYDTCSFSIGSKRVFANDSTVIMIAPPVKYNYGSAIYDEDDYKIVSLDKFVTDYELSKVSVYNVNKDNVAGLILIGSEVDLSIDKLTMMIKASTAKNDNGDIVDKFTVLQDGNKNDFMPIFLVSSDNAMYATIPTLGSLFIPHFNSRGEVTDYELIVGFNYNNKPYLTDSANNNYVTHYYFGSVTNKKGNIISISGNSGEDDIIIPTTANVYVYSNKGSKPETKVYAPYERYNVFSIDKGAYYDSDGIEFDEVFVLVREYKDEITDVVFYMY